jgi:transcription initiation factor TFIIB
MTITKSIIKQEGLCPECNSLIVKDEFRGERVCSHCGLVFSEREIDFSYKRSMYSQREKQKKKRTGTPITDLDISLHSETFINLNETNKFELKRALKKNNWVKKKERTLKMGKSIIEKVKTRLQLPGYLVSGAFLLFKKLKDKARDLTGRSLEGLILACLYYVSKEAKYPIFISELLENAEISQNKFKQNYNFLVEELNLKASPVNIKIYLEKFCYKLNIPYKLHKRVRNIFNKLPENYILGKSPRVIIGAILYIIVKKYNLEITQISIAKMLNVSRVSIRINRKKILKLI